MSQARDQTHLSSNVMEPKFIIINFFFEAEMCNFF